MLFSKTVPDVRESVSNLYETNIYRVACGDIVNGRLEHFSSYEKAL